MSPTKHRSDRDRKGDNPHKGNNPASSPLGHDNSMLERSSYSYITVNADDTQCYYGASTPQHIHRRPENAQGRTKGPISKNIQHRRKW